VHVVDAGRQGVREGVSHLELLREAAGDVVAGEAGAAAEVFVLAAAVRACAAGLVQPGDADACAEVEARGSFAARDDAPDGLVSRRDRQHRQVDLALDDVDVGSAQSAAGDVEHDLAGAGLRVFHFDECERPNLQGARFVEAPRAHDARGYTWRP